MGERPGGPDSSIPRVLWLPCSPVAQVSLSRTYLQDFQDDFSTVQMTLLGLMF